MGRNILLRRSTTLAQREGDTAPTEQPDNYAAQIVKLIPVEVVGVYLGISNLIEGQQITDAATNQTVQWIVFFTILLITPFYLHRAAGVTDKAQLWISTLSFIVWALSLGGPFALFFDDKLAGGLTIKFLGAILIMVYSLVVPIFYKLPAQT